MKKSKKCSDISVKNVLFHKISEKTLDSAARIRYNILVQGFSAPAGKFFTGNIAAMPHDKAIKRRYSNEKNIPAEEAPQKKGAWLHEENGNQSG